MKPMAGSEIHEGKSSDSSINFALDNVPIQQIELVARLIGIEYSGRESRDGIKKSLHRWCDIRRWNHDRDYSGEVI